MIRPIKTGHDLQIFHEKTAVKKTAVKKHL